MIDKTRSLEHKLERIAVAREKIASILGRKESSERRKAIGEEYSRHK